MCFFFFQAEDGIRDGHVTGVQTCALPIFLVVISGMLFGIFFYMMNVQKIGLYGILKAIGMKTSKLFQMMWTQMLIITTIALALSIGLSQLFSSIAPEGMPFHLTLATTGQLAVIFFIIGFLGATLSGLQIKNVQPLQAIQQGEVRSEERRVGKECRCRGSR